MKKFTVLLLAVAPILGACTHETVVYRTYHSPRHVVVDDSGPTYWTWHESAPARTLPGQSYQVADPSSPRSFEAVNED